MPVADIYSKRQKQLRGEVPEVYEYEDIPESLQVQIVYIMKDAFEIIKHDGRANKVYDQVYNTFCREHGRRQLDASSNPYTKLAIKDDTYSKAVEDIIFTAETDHVLGVIELFFQHTNQPNPYDKQSQLKSLEVPPSNEIGKKNYQEMVLYMIKKHSQYKNAVNELNHRFREHGVGYQYESGQIIRVDSQYLHSEAMQPALRMLSASMYEGANAEFRSAHENFRAKRYKECLNDCLKAFESCLKAICDKRGWVYGAKDTANRLINIVLKNELIPEFMESHLSGLRSALEAGVPTLRNQLAGHGQGTREVPVPEHIAAHALHLTASNILLLAKAEEKLPPDIPF